MASSYCRNCSGPKADIVANYCDECQNGFNARYSAFKEANPNAPDSDALYAGREALHERAMTSHRNLVDPRLHSRFNGGGNVIRGR